MLASDIELLREYARGKSETAFTALVNRHLNLVYSAALRQVRSHQLAEEVAQSAFTDLAQNAHRLAPDTILTAWLYQVTRRTAIDVVRREARRQLREKLATEMTAMNATADDWTHIEPFLDEAMSVLDDTDRAAVLLRYFENKSLREVGAALGASDDAAQKRVSRAVERLREFFAKRGVGIGAGGLVVVISANAVQSAPLGLATTISAAAVVAGTTVATTAISTAAKTITMTTLQKAIVTTALVAAVGTGIFEGRETSALRTEVQELQQAQSPLLAQIQQLQVERDNATNRIGLQAGEIARLRTNQNLPELLSLRGEVARLRSQNQQAARAKSGGLDPNDPSSQMFLDAKAIAFQIAKALERMPDRSIPELKLLTDVDWLTATKTAKFDTDADTRKTLSTLRSLAKNRMPMGRSLYDFAQANNGQLPNDLTQLEPYFQSALGGTPLDDATLNQIFARYKLLHSGNVSDYPPDAWFIAEKAPVDRDYDTRAKYGNGRSGTFTTGIGQAGDPDDPSY